MLEALDQKNPNENFITEIVDRTQELLRNAAAYYLDPTGFHPQDPEILFRLVGRVDKMRLLLVENKDETIQIQVHAQYPRETQVITLEIPSKGTLKLYEYKVAYDPRSGSLSTTAVPINAGVRQETLNTFLDLLGRIKK
ncbi:hypothetical protein HYT60_02490 [Candidatus Woesebacteria bacterium]|nr:hypothetical protein [Candidatus Woesebacteria bacterium]